MLIANFEGTQVIETNCLKVERCYNQVEPSGPGIEYWVITAIKAHTNTTIEVSPRFETEEEAKNSLALYVKSILSEPNAYWFQP